jgi:hypothetical protein
LNLKYIILFGVILLFVINSHNVYAVNSIDWIRNNSILFGSSDPPFHFGMTLDYGNIKNSFPLSVIVDASDEGDFTSNGIIDTIDVFISSSVDTSGVTYTLTETGPNDGIFTGTNFVFLKGNYKFLITDTVNLVHKLDHDTGCDPDDTITVLDTRNNGTGNGITVHSQTDLIGIGTVLTETGKNTCTFSGEIKFTTDSSDETTGTLQVSQGDILAFEVRDPFEIINAQIIPTINGKGSIAATYDDDQNTAEVFASYNGLLSGFHLADDGSGNGFGSPSANPGLVLNFIRSLIGGSSLSSPPTLGIDNQQKRIVEDGFSFNGNPVNVERFYTPYPLITTEVGKLNTIKLKIYEDKGPDNITHVGLSYGLGKGEIFNQGKATIEYDKSFDGIETVTLFDPNDVFGIVNVTTTNTECSPTNNAPCLEVTFEHEFRDTLEFNMVATNIWDFQRNGWQNYFNHGVEIIGESMNPPKVYSGIHKGHVYKLTETGKNTAVDKNGNNWTFDKIWNRDYIIPQIHDREVLNQQKIYAIKKLGFNYSDGQQIFGYSRTDDGFTVTKNQQKIEAQKVLGSICLDCQENSFEEINDIFSYDMPKRTYKLHDPDIVILMNNENKKAQEFLEQYFEKIYDGRTFD